MDACLACSAWALAAGILALIASWLLWSRNSQSHHLHYLLFTGTAGLLVGVALLVIGYRLAMKVRRNYDPSDPDEPSMKF